MTPVAAEDQQIGRRGSSADTGGAKGVGFRFRAKTCGWLPAHPGTSGATRPGSGSGPGSSESAAVIEVIRERQTSRHAGVGRQDRVPFDDADRAFEHECLAHPALFDDSGSIEHLDEGLAGTVASRAFACIDMNDAIIDLQSGQGGHHMLDHLDGRRTLSDRGAALGWDDVVDPRGHRRPIGQVGSHEDHARAGVGRAESERDVGSVEKTEPTHFRRAGECALRTRGSEHSESLHRTPDRGQATWLVGWGASIQEPLQRRPSAVRIGPFEPVGYASRLEEPDSRLSAADWEDRSVSVPLSGIGGRLAGRRGRRRRAWSRGAAVAL